MTAVKTPCPHCLDSGITLGLYGPDQCFQCSAHLGPISNRVFGCVSNLRLKGGDVDETLLSLARLLVPATSATPLPGSRIAARLGFNPQSDSDVRKVKGLAKRLRDEWRLPTCARREAPAGYYFAASPDEFLSWMRTTRAQAISELATAYHLFRANFPELAGQQTLEFVNGVSEELQEAIR